MHRGKEDILLLINKLVLSQTRHLHSGINSEMHLYGLHNQRRLLLFFLIGFKLSADFISVCELVHVVTSIHRDCMRRQKAHPKMTGV